MGVLDRQTIAVLNVVYGPKRITSRVRRQPGLGRRAIFQGNNMFHRREIPYVALSDHAVHRGNFDGSSICGVDVQGNLQATRMQKGVLLKNPESERPVCTFGSLDSHA